MWVCKDNIYDVEFLSTSKNAAEYDEQNLSTSENAAKKTPTGYFSGARNTAKLWRCTTRVQRVPQNFDDVRLARKKYRKTPAVYGSRAESTAKIL